MKMKNVKIVVAMAAAVALMFGSFVSCDNESHDSAPIDQNDPNESEKPDYTPPSGYTPDENEDQDYTPPPSGHDPDEDKEQEPKSRISVTLYNLEGEQITELTTEVAMVILSLDDYTDAEIASLERIIIPESDFYYRLDASSRGSFGYHNGLSMSKSAAAYNGDERKICFFAKVTADNKDPEIELKVGLYTNYDASNNTGTLIGEVQKVKLKTDKYVDNDNDNDYSCNNCGPCGGYDCAYSEYPELCNCDSPCGHPGCKEDL